MPWFIWILIVVLLGYFLYKRYLNRFLLFLPFLFVGCKKDIPEIQPLAKLGDPSRLPNLYIPESETGWAWSTGPRGLHTAYFQLVGTYVSGGFAAAYGLPNNSYHYALNYECLIANGIKGSNAFPFDPSGQKDFVIDRSEDGIIDSSYNFSYQFPGMIALKLYENGELAGPAPIKRIKQNFWVANNEQRVGFVQQRFYSGDTMVISWGAGDLYYNKILVPELNGQAKDGLYVVQVEINPDREIIESDYSDNVSVLPFRIQSGVAYLDFTAIQSNIARTPTNFQGQIIGKGNNKQVHLTWTSGADHVHLWHNDQPIPSHDFYIYEDEYFLNVPASYKGGTFKIVAHNKGIGSPSYPQTITVKK
jgi:hypothetical protein